MHIQTPSTNKAQRGAALVVALGLLSLILLLVATFILSMRAERQAARNARARENSREYASVGAYLAGCYYLPIPEDADIEDPTYLIPRVDWHDYEAAHADSLDNSDDMEEIGAEEESAIRNAFGSDVTITKYGPVFRDGIAALSGVEIEGQEAVFWGKDESTRFATLPSSITNFLPYLYRERLETNAVPIRWQYINAVNIESGSDQGSDVRLAMRVGSILVDLSGQADIHHLTTNQWRMLGANNNAEPITDIERLGPFVNQADLHSYLAAKFPNLSKPTLDALGTHSLDPNPYQIPYGTPLGSENLLLTNKFDLCSITNSSIGQKLVEDAEFASSEDPRWRWHKAVEQNNDVNNYVQALSNALFRIGPFEHSLNNSSNELARAIFWNLLNDLDADRYPQTDSESPWLDSYGVEALPLLSELSLTNTPSNSLSSPNVESFGYVPECPACQALRNAQRATLNERSYQASAEVWYPFSSTNDIPENVWLALHLYKTTYTNDVRAVTERIDGNIGHVTTIVETHWGTNVTRTAYTHSRDVALHAPPLQVQTLEFGSYVQDGNFYLSTGVIPDILPENTESQVALGGLSVTNNVVFSVVTNADDRLMLVASVDSTEPPLHLYDSVFDGPMDSLFAGETELSYSVSSNTVENLDDDTPQPFEFTYHTSLSFIPEDPSLLAEIIAALLPEPTEDDPSNESLEPESNPNPNPDPNPDSENTPPNPAPDPDPEPEPPTAPEPASTPSSLTLPLITTGLFNDRGEILSILSSTPSSEPMRILETFFSRFIQRNSADHVHETNDAKRKRYDVRVWYTLHQVGPSSQHGSRGLAQTAASALVENITPEPFRIQRSEFKDRFACVTNTPFTFNVPVEHSVWDTNGTCIAHHTVSNILPIGESAYTNVFYFQKSSAQHIGNPTQDHSWITDFKEDDFTPTEIPQPVENTLFFSAQLFLEEPSLHNLLDSPTNTDDPHDTPSSSSSLSLAEAPFDEAPGVGSNDDLLNSPSPHSGSIEPWLLESNQTFNLTVDDPRFNGRTHNWYFASPTHGTPPSRFPQRSDEASFWDQYPKFSGYPILHHDGLPSSIGDVGLLGTCEPWETVNLFHSANAKLLDLWCVGAPNGTNASQRAYGRIHPQTPFPMAAALLFADTLFGTNRLDRISSLSNPSLSFYNLSQANPDLLEILTNSVCTIAPIFHPIATNSLQLLAIDGLPAEPNQDDALEHAVFPFAQWMEFLAPHLLQIHSENIDENDTPSTASFENWRESALAKALLQSTSESNALFACEIPGIDQLEDLIRDLPNHLTFRQNLVLVITRSDALAPNARPLATTRLLSLIYRDAWTGKWYTLEQLEIR